jgi:type IV fimbrial biogenesis protein FimT
MEIGATQMVPSQKLSLAAFPGITLIELLVTLAVLGIIVTIALPSFRDLTLNQKVKTAAYDLYTSMIYARGEAVKDAANVTITAGAGGWQDGWQVVNASGVTLRTQAGYSSISITGSANSIAYQKTGRANLSIPVGFTLSVPGNSNVVMRCLLIDPSGLPKLLIDNNRNGNCYDG